MTSNPPAIPFGLRWINTYQGPNPLSASPVVEAQLQPPKGLSSSGLFPVLQSLQRQLRLSTEWVHAPMAEAVDAASLLGDALARLALALLNEIRGFLHAAGAYRTADQHLCVWVEHHHPDTSRMAVALAARMLNAQLQNTATAPSDYSIDLDRLWTACRQHHPDYQARILMEAARAMDVPYRPFLPGTRYWQFGEGRHASTYFESSGDGDSAMGDTIQGNKTLSKVFMRQMGVPVARHTLVKGVEQLTQSVHIIGYPCVLKPIDGSQAKGVSVNIRDLPTLQTAYHAARAISSKPLMLEQHVEGDVHRLLVVRGRLIAATRRLPAHVEGDGRHSVLQLVLQFNRARLSSHTPGSYHGACPLDAAFDAALQAQNLHRQAIPALGRRVRLRDIPLLGTGASNHDVTEHVHPDTRFLVEAMAQTLRLHTVGFDLISPDVRRSVHTCGAFLEINRYPSLRGHLVDNQDTRGIARAILGSEPRRLPALLIIGTQDQALPLLDLVRQYPALGWRLTGENAGVGPHPIRLQSTDLWQTAHSLVVNRQVEHLLIACQADDLVRNGLPLQRFERILITAPDIPDTLIRWLRQHTAALVHQPAAPASCAKQFLADALGALEPSPPCT